MKDIFTNEEIPTIKGSRLEIIKNIEGKVRDGLELSWVTTDLTSFEWADINEDISRFWWKLISSKFNEVHVGFLNNKTKETLYVAYEVNHNDYF